MVIYLFAFSSKSCLPQLLDCLFIVQSILFSSIFCVVLFCGIAKIMDKNDDLSREARYRLYCDERMAQQIRENSQELRVLETRIRAAYVNKSLKVQLAEREKKRLQEKIQIEYEIQQMKQKLNDDLQRERQQKMELRMQQEQHRRELLEQIADKQFKRKILYEEFLKEKIIIDAIMEQIEREQIEYGLNERFSWV